MASARQPRESPWILEEASASVTAPFKSQEDLARPILYHNQAATCWQPWLHGITPMVSSVYNWLRMENAWLDR